MEQTFSDEPDLWRDALVQEALALQGRALDEEGSKALLPGIKERPGTINLDWIQTLAPHLSARQTQDVYCAANLLQRLAQGVAP